MPSRKQRAVTGVPDERWEQLGKALQAWREDVLGYKSRTAFARERLPLTEEGNPNVRLIQDLEHNYRPGTYTKWSLEDAEKAYGITHESVLAFLHGEAGTLARASSAVLPDRVAYGPPGWQPPIADQAQRDAAAPYAMPIVKRLLELASRGVTDPAGEQVFLGDEKNPLPSPLGTPGDVMAWDGIGRRMPPFDRAYFIALLRLDDPARAGNSGQGATGA